MRPKKFYYAITDGRIIHGRAEARRHGWIYGPGYRTREQAEEAASWMLYVRWRYQQETAAAERAATEARRAATEAKRAALGLTPIFGSGPRHEAFA